MGKQKYTSEIIELVIRMRQLGKTIPEIQAATGMGKPSQQKLYRQRGIKLTEEQKDAAVIGARWKNHEPIVGGCKICSVCKTSKPVDQFHTAQRKLTGLTSSCKQCQKEYYAKNSDKKIEQVKIYKKNNPEKIKAKDKHYYEKNKDKYLANAAKWAKENPEKARECTNRYGRANQPKKNARTAEYRARKIHATPVWLTKQHKAEIRAIYENCPKGYHVDHVIPLRGEEVCGLHVPWNLQYLPGVENMSKGNKIQN